MYLILGFHRKFLATILLLLAAGQCAFAGKEFLAGPHEQIVPDQLLIGLQLGVDIQQILKALLPQAAASIISKEQNTYLIKLPPGIQALASKLLASHPLVNYVEPNRVRNSTVLPPNDTYINQQWALTTIQATAAWSYFPDHYLTAAAAVSNRVKVAVIDTGADCTHADFKNSGGTSTDAAQGGQFSWASSQALMPTTVSSPACPWADDNGHGTHTAGIVAAATDNATGVASLGYPLELIIYKTMNQNGVGNDYYNAQAIYDAIGAGAQVISLSLGGPGYSQTLQTAINSAWQNNVLVVAAAGNQTGNELTYPGDANFALGVAATDNTNTVAGWSNYGNWVKIAAPGVNILSTYPGGYATLSGTSMATPHVAALAGLLFAANPGISVAAVAQRIQQTAQSPHAGWNQYSGYGVIDAAAALGGAVGPFTQGSITGQVTDLYGNPINNATVTAGNQSFTTATDPSTGEASGLFRLNLSPGAYTVGVTQANYSPVEVQAVVVAGADTMLNIQLGVAYGEFTGIVTYNGVAVAGAVVEAVSSGLIQGTAVTNSSGAYTLYVPAGTYTLTASAANYLNATSASQSLSANGTVNVNLALSALGTITGTVTDANGIPVPNAHIDFTNGTYTGGTVTGPAGTYATYGIPAGTYTVTASASGYTSVSTASVSVTTNISTLVNFRFSSGVSLDSGLIGYWPFNEGAGTVAYDQSGNGYNAALTNTTWTSGPLGSAAGFNGSNSQAVTPNIPFGSAFSASVWVNPASSSQGDWAAIVQSGPGSGYYLGTDATGSLYKLVANSGAGNTGSCAFVSVTEGCAQGGTITAGWHLLTATYDGAAGILYIDGVAIANDTFSTPSAATVPLDIGRSWSSGVVWNGALYGLRLYNRALTASEVSSLFTQKTNLGITKTADAATVAAGSSIGYTLSVTNSGTGAASSAALTDVLPQGAGINWSISPAYTGTGTCSIANGTLGCSFGSLASGGSASVHIASATTASSCGVYANTASVAASDASTVQASATTTVQCSQTINFGALPNVALGTAPFTVSATSTSGLTVSFNSQTPGVCTVSGSTITLAGAGMCTIQATQAGSAVYTAAPSVNQSFTVTQESQTIAFGTLANVMYGSAPFPLSATSTSGLAVSFNAQNTGVCTVSGSIVTLVSAGGCTIQATQAGNAVYSAAPSVNQSFTVTKESQTINFGSLPNVALGTAPFTLSATSTSGLAASFNSLTSGVCTLLGPTVTLVSVGTCTIQATQAGNGNYSAAPSGNQSFSVTLESQTITFGSLPNVALGTAPFTVSATSTSGLAVSFNSQTTGVCTVLGSTVTLVSAGTCTIQAMQAGNGNCSAAPQVNQSFSVTLESQTIAFGSLANKVYGSAPFTVSATASSGLTVSFTSQTASVCTVTGSTVTLAAAGACTIQATQAGNATYSAAPSVNQSFSVTQESQTITFGALANKVYGSAPFTVSATASSGLTVSFTSQTASVCTVTGSTVTLAAAGACTIQATQAGNTNYAAAASVNQTFTVTPESQTISFGALANQAYGTAPVSLSATASSGLPVTFTSLASPLCSVSGKTVTIITTGTCTIQATQAGNASYSAAPAVIQSFTVTPASQTITFAALSNQSLGTAPFSLSATASSGLQVLFTSLTTPACTVSLTTVNLAAIGTCTIQATQAGSANYSAAAAVNQSFTITAGTAVTSVSILSFANTIVGKSGAVQTFTLQNNGNMPLTIASIAVTGSDSGNYQYTADAAHPCPISPATLGTGSSCTLDVAFAPASQGLHNKAQVAIVDNSGNVPGSAQAVALTGTGIVLSSIDIGASSGSLASGASEQFTATGTYSDNSTASLTNQATWTSSAPAVASMSATGVASAVSAGQTNITAALSGVASNSFALTVSAGTAASISVAGGSGQNAAMGTAFTSPLQALVKDAGGNVVANAAVTFTAPVSGASGSFANGLATYTTATNASGLASALTFTANSTGGAYSVTASVAGVSATASFSLTNGKAPALTITETPVGTFVQGQNAVYNVTVANGANAGPTSGTITVTESVPAGLTLAGLNGGPMWTCTVASASCTTDTVLNPGASSTIVIALSVPFNGPSASANGVSLSGGGSPTIAAKDPTPIVSACAVTLDSKPSVADVQAIINQALGIKSPANDLNGDGRVDIVDLQIVTNAAMGQSCSAS